jgi:nucleotide-binding universal stress UspA family protein
MHTNGKRILVPVNGIPASQDAFRWACQLARQTKAELHSVYVYEVPLEFPLNTEVIQENPEGEEVLAQIEAIAGEEKWRVQAQLLQARRAGPAIALEAEDRQMEMIILGVPYRNRLGSGILGSTASYLLGHAPCMLILRREPLPSLSLVKV